MCVAVIVKFVRVITLVLFTAGLGCALQDVTPDSSTGNSTGTNVGNAENAANAGMLDLGQLLIPLDYYLGRQLTQEERSNYQIRVTRAKMPKFFLFMPGHSIPVAGHKLQTAQDKDVIVVIHGLTESANEKWVKILRKKYVEHGKNVLVVDWEELSGCREELVGCYHNYAVPNTLVVGTALADYLTHIVNNNYISAQNIHIIGFCLGAHVGGIAGAIFFETTTEKFGRISGLDPAGADYDFALDSRLRLDSSDAVCVDVIHTNQGFVNPICSNYGLGITFAVGFLDFYPNGGQHQPGCEDRFGLYLDACSHRRAIEYYILSMISHVYIGLKIDYKEKISIGEGPNQYMGRIAQCRYQGSYYVNMTS